MENDERAVLVYHVHVLVVRLPVLHLSMDLLRVGMVTKPRLCGEDSPV